MKVQSTCVDLREMHIVPALDSPAEHHHSVANGLC